MRDKMERWNLARKLSLACFALAALAVAIFWLVPRPCPCLEDAARTASLPFDQRVPCMCLAWPVELMFWLPLALLAAGTALFFFSRKK
jgi:hypothetical protein